MLRKPGPKRLGSAADYHVVIVIYDPGTYTWVGRTNREGKKKRDIKKIKGLRERLQIVTEPPTLFAFFNYIITRGPVSGSPRRGAVL